MAQLTQTSGRAEPQKNAGAPEGGRQEMNMLNIATATSAGKNIPSEHVGFSEDYVASAWLDGEITKAERLGVTTQVIDLTPALARVLLTRNPNNRKLSSNAVANFARDMANGSWSFNGEPVIIAGDGLLNDGQHRCAAVVESNTTVRVVLVIGTARESRLTLDQGRNRLSADYLSMNGYVDAAALAAAGGYLWQYQNHGRLSRQRPMRPTKGEVLAIVDATPGLVRSLAAIPTKNSDIAGGRATLAFCHWLFSMRTTTEEATAFIEKLTGGAGLLARDPILYARNRLSVERGRMGPNEKAELIFRAWNADRRGETPKTMPVLGGALPLLER